MSDKPQRRWLQLHLSTAVHRKKSREGTGDSSLVLDNSYFPMYGGAWMLKPSLSIIAIISISALSGEPPKWANEAAKDLREAMKKNKYEEICAFYGKFKQAGMFIPAGPKIEINRHGSWSILVTVEKIDKKADVLTVAEGQDISLTMDIPHTVGIRKDDQGADFYFIVWKERHNDVDYMTLTAIKHDGIPADQFAPKALRDLELAAQQKSEFVQPDYAKWEQVREGMTEEEVKKLLGEPLRDSRVVGSLTYGRIQFASPAMPDSFEFYISFKQGTVSDKLDPFGGELSKDGKPTAPLQITPADRTTFNHYPRVLDLRWRPSSGEYPIVYIVEVENAQHDGKDGLVYWIKRQYRADCPYQAITFNGVSNARWRVMAVNKKGQSAWTEWRYFRFDEK